MSEFNWYFGDMHSHNQLGYGMGTLQRSYAIANTPVTKKTAYTIGDLFQGAQAQCFDNLKTFVKVHRPVPPTLYTLRGQIPVADGPAYYYLRVAQNNGQMAWTSPIWIDQC